jgi:hypothetical protein
MVGHGIDYNPDLDGDGFVQMEEAFAYANDNDTWSPYGYYYPYTTGDEENPQQCTKLGLPQSVLTLCGFAGNINNNVISSGRNYLFGGELSINSSLYVSGNSRIHFGNEIAKMTVMPGGTLTFDPNIYFFGDQNNRIDINGNLIICQLYPGDQGASFICNSNNGYFDGLYLNNDNLNIIMNKVTFTKANLHNYCNSFTITNSFFSDCFGIDSHAGDIEINNTHFFHAWVSLGNQSESPFTASISNCSFSDNGFVGYGHCGINIWNYDEFLIEGNSISGYYNGIQLMQAGEGNVTNQTITENEISDCSNAGIVAYNSVTSINNNNVHDNYYGLRLLNNCNIKLSGNSSAVTYSETQELRDNTSYELYSVKKSFPWYFRYNAIIDEDNIGNPSDPLIYYDDEEPTDQSLLDVRYNCWGENFDPSQDFYPINWYLYNPIWCPGDGGQSSTSPDESLYLSGISQFEANNYANARNLFQSLVQDYPESKFAQAAMKELFRLEQFADDNYFELKQYYLNNDSIQADSVLLELGNFLANRCNIKIESWSDAIAWYENNILNPESIEDSIFAIIDLGYTYLLMPSAGYKSSYTGSLTQYKPKSEASFCMYRDYLLSLLPFFYNNNANENSAVQHKYGKLLYNIPNPFSSRTKIWFTLSIETDIIITIQDVLGREIRRIDGMAFKEGTWNIEFSAEGFQPGIYCYSLVIKGKTVDSKRMIIF